MVNDKVAYVKRNQLRILNMLLAPSRSKMLRLFTGSDEVRIIPPSPSLFALRLMFALRTNTDTDCSRKSCPKDGEGRECGGHGLCANGTCFCAPGFAADAAAGCVAQAGQRASICGKTCTKTCLTQCPQSQEVATYNSCITSCQRTCREDCMARADSSVAMTPVTPAAPPSVVGGAGTTAPAAP